MDKFPVRWGKYVLLEHLASGGMAEIYLALQYIGTGGHRLVIIKRARGGRENQKELRELFKIEAQALISLQSPHIVQTYDVEIGSDAEPYLIMEYLDGLSLKKSSEALEAQALQKLPLAPTMEIARQIALGLSAAHECVDPISGKIEPILHRDVSPHNIILTSAGYVKLIDFGVAKAKHLGSATVFSGQVKGKFTYMAPEQFQASHKLDARADIFCLGVILWELASGKRLFSGIDDNKTLAIEKYIEGTFKIEDLSTIDKNIDHELSEFVFKMLSINPESRPKNAKEISKWIENYQRSHNLSSGTEFLKTFVSGAFGDLFFTEKQRIQTLIENTKKVKLNDDYPTVLSNNNPLTTKKFTRKDQLAYIGLGFLLLSLALIPIKFFINKNKNLTNSISSNDSEEQNIQNNEINRGQLPAEDRNLLREIMGEVQNTSETRSESLKKAWEEATHLSEKLQRPKIYRDEFLKIPQEERSLLIKKIHSLILEYQRSSNEIEKIKILKNNSEDFLKLPPPRPKNMRSRPENDFVPDRMAPDQN
ncbi:MAG: serine/threonine protein kinase [Proteobacteria bacterium]|nr:serine/threonine protein kinase [Pseudomonadota bacterium]